MRKILLRYRILIVVNSAVALSTHQSFVLFAVAFGTLSGIVLTKPVKIRTKVSLVNCDALLLRATPHVVVVASHLG